MSVNRGGENETLASSKGRAGYRANANLTSKNLVTETLCNNFSNSSLEKSQVKLILNIPAKQSVRYPVIVHRTEQIPGN